MKGTKDKIAQFYSTNESIIYSLNTHLNELINWVNISPFIHDYNKSNIIEGSINPNVITGSERIDENYILNDSLNYLITGNPGSGKTVYLKRLIFKVITDESRSFGMPILVKARDLKNGSIFDEIKRIFGNQRLETIDIIDLFSITKFIIFIDGFDEVYPSNRENFINEVINFYSLKNVRIISTSRVVFDLPNLPDCKYCTILPYSYDQVYELAKLHLSRENAEDFLSQMSSLNIPISPLFITNLILIYERFKKLPKNIISVYKYLIKLLIEDWDSMRSVVRRSPYAELDSDSQLSILSFIAFDLFHNHQSISYTQAEILRSIYKIHQRIGIRQEAIPLILDDIISNTGIIINLSHDNYQFSHKSLQEYLAAEYLIRLPNIPFQDILKDMPSVLSFCVLLSSDPIYFLAVILDSLKVNDEYVLNIEIFFMSLILLGGEKYILNLENLVIDRPEEAISYSNPVIKALRNVVRNISSDKSQ